MFRSAAPTARARLLTGFAAAATLALASAGPAAAQEPTAPTTPPATPPSLTGPATTATATWQPPAEIREDAATTLGVQIQANGQVTFRTRLVRDTTVCPTALPASATRPVLAPPAHAYVPGQPWLASGISSRPVKTSTSGYALLCGWLVADGPAGAQQVLAQFAQEYWVTNRRSSIQGALPADVSAGQSFKVTLTGRTAGPGRRALAMADPYVGQSCADMVKAPSGARHLQGVWGLGAGNYTKTLNLRFRNATTPGQYLLCIQVVELTDRYPEGLVSSIVNVAPTIRCQTATIAAQRRGDELELLRDRRDRALERLKKAKAKAEPARQRYLNAKRAANKRIERARAAHRRAKSKAAKQRASRTLAQVKRVEARRLQVKRRPYAKLERPVLSNRAAWKRWTRGVKQIDRAHKRAVRDRATYC